MSVVANVAINVDTRGAVGELRKVDDAAGQLNQTFGALKAAVAALGLGMAIKSIADVGNESQKSKIQIQALTAQYGELNQASQSIARIQKVLGISAIDAREGYGQLYAALRSTGVSTQQLEVLFVGLTNAARLSGAGAAEAQGALLQLKQAFASGTLSGDELRAVLEAMPAFTAQLAKETDALGLTTNATSADIKKLGSEGKITSDILFAAAKKLAQVNAPGLTSTEQLAAAFKDLRERIAEAFGPSIITAANTLFGALTGVGNWFKANQPAISAFAKGFIDIAKSVGPIAIGIFAVVKAYQAWNAVSKAVAATQAFIATLTGPRGLALIAAAAGASALAYKGLNDLSASVTTEIAKQKDEAIKAATEFKNIANTVDTIPRKTKSATEAAAQLKNEIAGVKGQYQEIVASQDLITNRIENSVNIAQARYEAEKSIRDTMIDQLKTQLDQTTNQSARIQIARAIYNLEIANAEAALILAIQRIKAEQSRAAIAVQTQKLKAQELRVEMAILSSRKQDTSEIERAIRLQDIALQTAFDNQNATNQIAIYQAKSADATYQAQKNAAELAFQQNSAAKAARQFTDNLRQAAPISQEIGQGLGQVFQLGYTWQGPSFTVPLATANNSVKTHNASGGLINRPTATMVGEAGGEYIVPESKAANFAANYLSGARGTSAIIGNGAGPSITIQTGPVMQQNGQNYVTIQDMEAGLQAVANTILNNSRSYSSRRFAGVS